MKSWLFGALVAFTIFISGTAQAYIVRGNITCPTMIREDANPEFRNMNMWWILGHISARNFENNYDVTAGVSNEELYSQALNFCRNSPTSDLEMAARAVYIYHWSRQYSS